MVEIICPICFKEVKINSFKEIYFSDFNKQEYKMYECPYCKVHFWEPRKIEADFYENEPEEGYELFHLGIEREIGSNHKMFFKYCPLKSGKLLDVGCGDGLFLKEAEKKGFDCWGIDFDKKSIMVAKEKFGIKKVFPMSLEEFVGFAQKENLKFDVITFFEVLEHQEKPREFINLIKVILRNGGYIAGSLPNRESKIMEHFRKYYTFDFPPHHFLRFSKKALENFLTSQGFKNVFISSWDISFGEVLYLIQQYFFKDKLSKTFRKLILGDSKDISLFKAPRNKQIIYQSLKKIRNIIFFPISLIGKSLIQPSNFYFQAKRK